MCPGGQRHWRVLAAMAGSGAPLTPVVARPGFRCMDDYKLVGLEWADFARNDRETCAGDAGASRAIFRFQ